MAALTQVASGMTTAVRAAQPHMRQRAMSGLSAASGSSLFSRSLAARFPNLAKQQPLRRMAQVVAQEPTAEAQHHQQHQQLQQQQQQEGEQKGLQTQQGQQGALQRRQGRTALSPIFADLLDPWFPSDRTLRQMLSSVDHMFDDIMQPSLSTWSPSRQQRTESLLSVRPPWDVQETADAYHMRFDLPGMTKEEVSVKLDRDGVLFLSAQHKEGEKEGDVWKSRMSKTFKTRVQLPDGIKKEGITAEMKHGVLFVSVPKETSEEHENHIVDVPVA